MRRILFQIVLILISTGMAAYAGNTGLHEGKLLPCPKALHCVSSQEPAPSRRIEPFPYNQDKTLVRNALINVIRTTRGAKLITADEDYLHAEFRSAVLRFADDLEAYFEPDQKIIHFRSASRMGYFDFGVNRLRIEKIKKNLSEALKHLP